MGHHAWAKIFSEVREQSEQHSVDRDEHHEPSTLVTMRCAENDCGEGHSSPRIARQSAELLLQIAAKKNLFEDARGYAQQQKESEVPSRLRQHAANALLHA